MQSRVAVGVVAMVGWVCCRDDAADVGWLSRVETDSRVPEPEQAVGPNASRVAAAVRIRTALAEVDRTGYFLRVGARPTRSGMVWA